MQGQNIYIIGSSGRRRRHGEKGHFKHYKVFATGPDLYNTEPYHIEQIETPLKICTLFFPLGPLLFFNRLKVRGRYFHNH
jgi:hypothetical protein